MEFVHTHEIILNTKEADTFWCLVEVDCDSEINSLKPLPIVKEEKIEPMDGLYPIFYTTTLFELVNAGFDIHLIPIDDE